jgi:hypothetical protein
MRLLFVQVLLLHTIFIIGQEPTFWWQGKVVSQRNQEPVPFASLKVFTENNTYAFIADEAGAAEIWSIKIKTSDSILISSIGYKTYKSSCLNLLNNQVIALEPFSYSLDEVVVKATSVKKTISIGNLAKFSLNAFSADYGEILALYIPANGIKGKIKKLRFYMQDLFDQDYIYLPFRVRLYACDTVNKSAGKDLLNDILVASLRNKWNNWLEVDISSYNISLPDEGIVVGAQILPKGYYIARKYISKENIVTEFLKGHSANVPSFGSTSSLTESKQGIISLGYTVSQGWVQAFEDNSNFLINIEVEPYK